MSIAFTPAWLLDAAEATKFLPRRYSSKKKRAEATARASERVVEPAVLAAIEAPSEAQQNALQKLSKPGTVCVVTGQQAGLFGGPLYTIYKTAAALVNARKIEAETGTPCVAIFWLQNEDHDFDEIASCRLLNTDDERVTVSVTGGASGLRSIAFVPLEADLDTALSALEEAMDGTRHGSEVIELLRQCYQVGLTADRCFRTLIQRLFAEHGLLILDPSHPDLVLAARLIHRRAIQEALPIAEALRAHSDQMAAAGFSVQVHVRPTAPLSFVHPEGRSGPRYRFEPSGAGYQICGSRASVSIPDALETGALSTSALLRPILQDSWLPTVAYVGGPGEIAYLAQLPPLYAHFELPMPLIVPRARFRVGDAVTARLLKGLGLQGSSLSQPLNRLLAQVATPGGIAPDVLETELLEQFERVMAGCLPTFEALDKGLFKHGRKAEATVKSVIGRLMERYRRAQTLNDTVATQRLDRVRLRLCPDGAPQERCYSWPHCAARYGIDAFTRAAVDAVIPFDGTLKDLQF